MSPLIVVLTIVAVVCAIVLLASIATGDYSWVDRSWSIVPAIYVWMFAGFAGLADTRPTVMAVLVTLWAARLTFNFARKGGYNGVEDYRWAVLRSRMTARQFQIFNVFFITVRSPRCTRDGAVRGLLGRGDGFRPAAVELPAGQESRGAGVRAPIRQFRTVALQPAPQLYLRASAVVGALSVWCDRGRVSCAVDGHRRAASHPAIRGVNAVHRSDHAGEISRICALPGDDVCGGSLVSATCPSGGIDRGVGGGRRTSRRERQSKCTKRREKFGGMGWLRG